MLKSIQKLNDKIAVITLMGLASLPATSYAASVKELMTDITDDTQAIGSFAKIAFMVAGFIVLAMGLYKFISNNPQESTGDKAKWVLIGALLLAIGAVVDIILGSGSMSQGASNINFGG